MQHTKPAAPSAATTHHDTPAITVRATHDGIDADAIMRRAGDVFTIPGDCHPANFTYTDDDPRAGKPHPRAGTLIYFSDKWMEKVDGRHPHAPAAPPAPVHDPGKPGGKPTGATNVLT